MVDQRMNEQMGNRKDKRTDERMKDRMYKTTARPSDICAGALTSQKRYTVNDALCPISFREVES